MSTFTIRLFGAFKQSLNAEEIKLTFEKSEISSNELSEALNKQFPQFQEFAKFKIAKNGELLNDENEILTSSDEIALLPPYAGG